jgi:lipid-binding SYLF domain-containing protein
MCELYGTVDEVTEQPVFGIYSLFRGLLFGVTGEPAACPKSKRKNLAIYRNPVAVGSIYHTSC